MRVRNLALGLLTAIGICVYPVINLYSNNLQITSINLIYRSLLIITVIGTLLYVGFTFIYRNVIKSALFIVIFQVFNLTFSSIVAVVSDITKLNKGLLELYWGAIILVILVLIFLVLFKIKLNNQKGFVVLFLFVFFLLIYPVIIIAQNFPSSNLVSNKVEVVNPQTDLPDIYLIVLDGHARSDILKEYYGYDNLEFINNLRELGFYVADTSTSNYSQTPLTVSSMLNMNYLQDLGVKYSESYRDRSILTKLIMNNEVVSKLKTNGYKYVVFDSGWSIVDSISNYDYKLRTTGTLNEFETVLINDSPLGVLLFSQDSFQYKRHAKRIVNTLSSIPLNLNNEKSPVFVYAHVLSPHPPFVFDEYGKLVKDNRSFLYEDAAWKYLPGNTAEEYKIKYVSQMKYINKLTINSIQKLLNQNPNRQKYIVIQSDHGPASEFGFESLSDGFYKERMSTLSAFYVPDELRSKLYSTITPVNIFRLILSEVLAVDYALLEDKSYYSDFKLPYKFEDVTEIVSKRG